MKYKLLFLTILILIPVTALGAAKTLPSLTAATAPDNDDLFLCREDADTEDNKCTGAQIATMTFLEVAPDLFLESGGVINFNAGDVTLTHSANTLTLGGGALALGANNLTMTGSLAAPGSRVTKGWFTDIEATNAILSSVGFDCVGAVDCDFGSADITDMTFVTDGGTVTIDGSITLESGDNIIVGANTLTTSDKLDGEQIADDTIDDDSIDFSDVTLADLTFDVNSVSKTEFGYLDGVTSAIQTQLGTKQAADADLDTFAGITPSANVQSLLGAADYAAARGLLDLEAGTDFYSVSAADTKFQPQIIGISTKTANYTFTCADRSGIILFNSAANLTGTLPKDTTENCADGNPVSWANIGSGTLTVVGEDGTTVYTDNGGSLTYSSAGSRTGAAISIGTDTWLQIGGQ